MTDLHYIQLEILKKLLFSEGLKFSEINPVDDLESNQLSFHLDQLIKLKHIYKEDGHYKLTDSGKEFANRMDTDSSQMKKQGKRGIIMCCYREGKTEPELLIYTRMKHPFYGSQGYSSGKVWYGERTWETAIRELKEETNLDATDKPELFMIEHHLVFDKENGDLLEDKYFYFYRFHNPKGEIVPNDEGLFEWVPKSKLRKYFRKPFESVDRLMYITDRILDTKENLSFEEVTHQADNF